MDIQFMVKAAKAAEATGWSIDINGDTWTLTYEEYNPECAFQFEIEAYDEASFIDGLVDAYENFDVEDEADLFVNVENEDEYEDMLEYMEDAKSSIHALANAFKFPKR